MRRVVGVLVPRTFGIMEPVELLLVEGGALLRLIGDGDGVVRATLAFAGLGGVGAIAVLVVPGWTITIWTCRVVVPLSRTICRVTAILVAVVGALGILHVRVHVDDGYISEMVLGLLSNIFLHSSMLWRPWWKWWIKSLSSTSVIVLRLAKYLVM